MKWSCALGSHGNLPCRMKLPCEVDGCSEPHHKRQISEELGLQSDVSSLCIQWTGSVTRKQPTSWQVELRISGLHGGADHAQTVLHLDLPQRSLDPHKMGLPVRSFSNALPKVVIGLDKAAFRDFPPELWSSQPETLLLCKYLCFQHICHSRIHYAGNQGWQMHWKEITTSNQIIYSFVF